MSSKSKSKPSQDEDIEMSEDDIEDKDGSITDYDNEDTSEFANLDASDTSSSEEETDLSIDKSQEVSKKENPTLNDKVAKSMLDKYSSRIGKQLYVQFPHKLPEDDDELQTKARNLSPLVTFIHRPRQKYVRFCLVDFNSKEDRDSALKSIKAAVKTNKEFKGIIVKLPRTENDKFFKELIERKVKSIENKKAKARLKRASKQAQKQDKAYTSSIVIINLPKTSSAVELRTFYPTAVDIQIKQNNDKMKENIAATITFPSTKEASAAIRKNVTLGGIKLITRFDNNSKTKPHARGKNKKKFKKLIIQ